MEKKEDLEIGKAPEELTEQDLEKVNGGYYRCLTDIGECSGFYKCIADCDYQVI